MAFLRDPSFHQLTAQVWPEMQRDSSARVVWTILQRLMTRPGAGPRAWVCFAKPGLRGLVIGHPRAGNLAWDVQTLLVANGAYAAGVELLEALSTEAVRREARRVFLATPPDAEPSRVARQAGFTSYTSETVFIARPSGAVAQDGLLPARPRLRQDTQALFQLYNAAVPCKVRFAEAATLDEWSSLLKGSRPWASSVGGSNRHYVWESPEGLMGWLQVTRGGRGQHFSLLVHPSHLEAVEGMLLYSLSRLNPASPVYCAVREYQPETASALERLGFAEVAHYLVCAREMTARVPSRAFVPARA